MTIPTPGPTPGALLGLSGGYWQACVLHAAAELDLFAALDPDPRPVADLARRTGAEPRALGMLLAALAAMGLARREEPGYAAPEEAVALLSSRSPRSVRPMILHHHYLMESWSRLPEALRTGRPVAEPGFPDPKKREAFLLGMLVNALAIAPALARDLDLSGRKSLLDLGGGPGTYAVHFCLAHPGLSATVLDLPSTRAVAEATIRRFGLEDRVRFHAADFAADPLPGPFDAAWLSHILHGEDPDTCQDVVDKAAQALAPGGLLLVHEFILDDTGDGPLFPALFSLNMLVQTRAGQSYTEGELRSMMTRAGLTGVRRLGFRGPNDSGVLAGVK